MLLCFIISTPHNKVMSLRSGLEDKGHIHFSSDDIPVSVARLNVYKEIWFRYILELASRFNNRNSIPETLIYLYKKVQKAYNWCKPDMHRNYIYKYINYTDVLDQKYLHIPCGKIIFEKLSTDQTHRFKHAIWLANVDDKHYTHEQDYKDFNVNVTIHSFTSSVYREYLTGHPREVECKHIVLTILYSYVTRGHETYNIIKRCGNIQRQNFIFRQGLISISVASGNQLAEFQLIVYFQVVNLVSHIDSDYTIEIYSYNSSSTFYPNLATLYEGESIFPVHLVRWRIRAIIGQIINLELYRLSSCSDDLEAVSIYDGPVKVFDQLVCTFIKEPTDPTTSQAPTQSTASKAPTQSTVPLVSYNSTFTSKINYCLNIVRNTSNIFFTFEVHTMASTKIRMEHDQKYQLQVTSGTNTIYYRSWQFTSDFFILLELAALRQFGGYEHECLYGGIVLNDIGNPLDLQYGSICTTHQGYEPLFSTPYWYFNRHGGVLTVYAFHDYFTIDFDLILTSQLCEGITNICSTHCM